MNIMSDTILPFMWCVCGLMITLQKINKQTCIPQLSTKQSDIVLFFFSLVHHVTQRNRQKKIGLETLLQSFLNKCPVSRGTIQGIVVFRCTAN